MCHFIIANFAKNVISNRGFFFHNTSLDLKRLATTNVVSSKYVKRITKWYDDDNDEASHYTGTSTGISSFITSARRSRQGLDVDVHLIFTYAVFIMWTYHFPTHL